MLGCLNFCKLVKVISCYVDFFLFYFICYCVLLWFLFGKSRWGSTSTTLLFFVHPRPASPKKNIGSGPDENENSFTMHCTSMDSKSTATELSLSTARESCDVPHAICAITGVRQTHYILNALCALYARTAQMALFAREQSACMHCRTPISPCCLGSPPQG